MKYPDSVEVIECTGEYIIPGGIDPHTHIEMPGVAYRVAVIPRQPLVPFVYERLH